MFILFGTTAIGCRFLELLVEDTGWYASYFLEKMPCPWELATWALTCKSLNKGYGKNQKLKVKISQIAGQFQLKSQKLIAKSSLQ